MQELYDEMLPGITERQGAYAAELGAALGDALDVARRRARARPRRHRGADRASSSATGVDGVLVVMLTYGPGMRVARALSRDPAADLPRQRPAGPDRDRRLGHGRPDLQPGHPRRAGHGQRDGPRRPAVPRRDRRLALDESFATAVTQWARAAAAVTRWRSLKVAVFGYAMNGMGDIRVDEHSLLRDARPAGRRARAGRAAPRRGWPCRTEDVRALIAEEDERFEIDPRLTDAEREDHARMQLGLEQLLDAGGYRAYSHALRRDRRGRALRPPAARRRLEPDGQGLRLRRRGRPADRAR